MKPVLPPEQAMGDLEHIDVGSDVYSLAAAGKRTVHASSRAAKIWLTTPLMILFGPMALSCG
jgi:hypothetical protein